MLLKQGDVVRRRVVFFAMIFLTIYAFNVQAEEGALSLIKQKGYKQDKTDTWEDSGAVLLEMSEEIVLSETGTFEFTRHEKVKIVSERGKKFGQIGVNFNNDFDKIKSIEAYTICPDGQKIKATKMRDFVPSQPSDIYSGDFVRIIYMPRVEIGSIVEYTIKKDTSYPIYKKTFDYVYYFGGTVETKKSRFTITLPETKKLLFKTYNTNIAPTITNNFDQKNKTKKRQITYTWEANDISKIASEEGMPPVEEVIPWLSVSTIEDWDSVKNLWWDNAKESFQIGPSIRNKVKELSYRLESDKEKASAIVGYVAQDIKYLGLEFDENIFVPEKASDVFRNKYGDCKGKSVLLMAMLHEAGIESYPVLLRSRSIGKIDMTIPMVGRFNHVIVYCKLGNEEYWLDPTLKFAPLGYLSPQYQNVEALVLFKEKSKFMMTSQSSESDKTETISAKVDVGKDGKSIGIMSIVFDKWMDVLLKNTLEELSDKESDELIYNLFGELSGGGTMVGYEIKNKTSRTENIRLDFKFESSGWATAKDDYLTVRPALTMVGTGFFNKPQRKHAIFSLYSPRKESDIKVSIPAEYELKSLPSELDIDSAAGKVSMQCLNLPGTLNWKKSISNDRMYISPADYCEVKNLISRAAETENQQAIFIKRR